MSSTCVEHASVHPQEDLYVQFYGITFMHPYKQSGRCHPDIKVKSVSYVVSYDMCVSQCTVQKR